MRLCIVFYCAMFFASCGDEQDSRLHHKVDEPVRDSMAWNWIQVSKDLALDIMGYPNHNPAAVPLESVAQYWVDELDSSLRVRYPNQMLWIPKPEVLVLNDASVNAYVQTFPVCYSGRFIFGEGEHKTEYAHYVRSAQWDFSPTPCVPGLSKDVTPLIESFKSLYPECQITKTGRETYRFYGCESFEDLNRTANHIVLDQTSNIITFFKGIFSLMEKEEEFVAVIYHELAHYYRSHGVALSHEYRFLYDSDHQDRTQTPVPQEGKNFSDYFEAHAYLKNYFPVLPNAQLEAPAYLMSGEIAAQVCSSQCSKSCQKIANWYQDGYQKKAFGLYPFAESSMLSESLYSHFESAAALCLQEVHLDSFDVKELKWDLYRDVTPRQKDSVIKWIQQSLDDFNGLQSSENLWLSMLDLSKQIKQKYLDSEKLMQQSQDENIGWYTEEQEADELSLEWMAMVGVDPRHGVSAYLQLADMYDSSQSCRKLQERGWVDDMGFPSKVSLGGFADPHHDACYRAWNAEQEIHAHQYTFAPHRRRGVEWERIRNHAKSAWDKRK